jgi:hypothetical protein
VSALSAARAAGVSAWGLPTRVSWDLRQTTMRVAVAQLFEIKPFA